MTRCQQAPLAASVDIDEWRSPPRRMPTRITAFSPCFDMCIVLWLGAVAWVAALRLYESTTLLVSYGLLLMYMKMCCPRDTAALHIVLSVICAAFAAASGRAAFAVWSAFIACVMHVMHAMLIVELDRLGDCRKCLQDAHHCNCGRTKEPLPAGTLDDAACTIQERWRRRQSLRSSSNEPSSLK